MSATASSIDGSSKRWLVVLAVTVVASIASVAYSFLHALSPAEPSVVAPSKSAAAISEVPVARSEPDWNGSAGSQAAVSAPAPAARPDPFAAQEAADARAAAGKDPVANEKAVHREAEYLRNLISQGKLPKSYGNLTKEQVDQMEKDGVMIN